jgi:hypothetical protein
VNAASKDRLESGDFKSVDFETAQDRLEKIAGIAMPQSDKNALKSIRRMRNRISHLKTHINIEQVKSVVARGILVFLDLYREPLLRAYHDSDYEAQVNLSLARVSTVC